MTETSREKGRGGERVQQRDGDRNDKNRVTEVSKERMTLKVNFPLSDHSGV